MAWAPVHGRVAQFQHHVRMVEVQEARIVGVEPLDVLQVALTRHAARAALAPDAAAAGQRRPVPPPSAQRIMKLRRSSQLAVMAPPLLLPEGIMRAPNGRGVAQPGSALAWGARGRRFKSSRPDQFLNQATCTHTANKSSATGPVTKKASPAKSWNASPTSASAGRGRTGGNQPSLRPQDRRARSIASAKPSSRTTRSGARLRLQR